MRLGLYRIALLCLLPLLFACGKREAPVFEPPSVKEMWQMPLDSVAHLRFWLDQELESGAVLRLKYGPKGGGCQHVAEPIQTVGGAYYAEMSDLEPEKEYEFCISVDVGYGEALSPVYPIRTISPTIHLDFSDYAPDNGYMRFTFKWPFVSPTLNQFHDERGRAPCTFKTKEGWTFSVDCEIDPKFGFKNSGCSFRPSGDDASFVLCCGSDTWITLPVIPDKRLARVAIDRTDAMLWITDASGNVPPGGEEDWRRCHMFLMHREHPWIQYFILSDTRSGEEYHIVTRDPEVKIKEIYLFYE